MAMGVFLFMIVAFFVGAIPTALLMGRAFRGIDIREHGSGNVGATNAFRVLGRRLGAICLCLDVFKGLLPVAILPAIGGFRPGSAWPEILIGVSAVAGHVFSPFLGGRGGKGVATALGVFLAIAPWPTFFALVVGVVIIAVTGFVSAGSVTGAVLLPLLLFFSAQPTPVFAIAAVVATLVLLRHRSNICRILAGEELSFWGSANQTLADEEPIPLAGEAGPGDGGTPRAEGE